MRDVCLISTSEDKSAKSIIMEVPAKHTKSRILVSPFYSFCPFQFPHLLKRSWYFGLMTWRRKQHCNTWLFSNTGHHFHELTDQNNFKSTYYRVFPLTHIRIRLAVKAIFSFLSTPSSHILVQSQKPQLDPFCGTSNLAIAETPWQQRQFLLQVRQKVITCYRESMWIMCLHEYFYIKFYLLPAGFFFKFHHCVPQKLLWQIWQILQKQNSKGLKRKSDCSKF